MATNLDLKGVKHVRLTCEHATIDNLSLDMDLSNGEGHNPKIETKSPPLVAKDHAQDGKYHLLLAASGSVATIKLPNIIKGLAKHENVAIRIILTHSASQFLQGQAEEQPDLTALSKLKNVEAIYRDADEWKTPWNRGAPILHIELRRWAHLLVIAPLSANTLAKLSNGLSDNLLTSVVRAWEVQPWIADGDSPPANGVNSAAERSAQKQILVAPAMNTAMWRHPLTRSHLQSLVHPFQDHTLTWIQILWPVEKELACGDTGDGAMTDWKNIVSEIDVAIAQLFPPGDSESE